MSRVWLPRMVAVLAAVMLALTGMAAPASAAERGRPKGTGPESGSGTGSGQAKLVDIRVGQHKTYDRVVFDFAGGVPAYDVAYGTVDAPGTGEPVDLRGSHSLEVTLQSGSVAEGVPQTLTPELPAVAQTKLVGFFEGVTKAGIGVATESQVGFRAFTLSDPARLVIDVAHPAEEPGGNEPPQNGDGPPGNGNEPPEEGNGDELPRTVIADYNDVPLFRVIGDFSEMGYCIQVTEFAASRKASAAECDPLPSDTPVIRATTLQPFDKGDRFTVVTTTNERAVEFDLIASDGSVVPEEAEEFKVVELNGRGGRAFAPHRTAGSLQAIRAYSADGELLARLPISPQSGGDNGSDSITEGETPQGGVATGIGGAPRGMNAGLLWLAGAVLTAGAGAIAWRLRRGKADRL